jgi:hypothetical protein
MNERIKSLLAKAHLEAMEDTNHVAEKFAELIITECANVAWDIAHQHNSDEINDVGYSILQHFGVE